MTVEVFDTGSDSGLGDEDPFWGKGPHRIRAWDTGKDTFRASTSGCSVGRLHVYSWPCEVAVPVIIPISRVITQEGGEPEAVVQLAECLPSIGPWVTPPALHKPSLAVCVIPARRRWRQDEKCRVILSCIGTSPLPPTTPSIISR